MAIDENPDISSQKFRNHHGNLEKISYKLHYWDNGGYGFLDFKLVAESPILTELIPSLSTSDRVAEITQFIPHGSMDIEKIEIYRGYGIGLELLDFMVYDSARYGAKAVFSKSEKPNFQALLKRNGFEGKRPDDPIYFQTF